MLKRLRRWLGWDSESGPFDFGDLQIPPRGRPAGRKAAADPSPPKPAAKRVAAPAEPASAVKPPPAAKRAGAPEVLDSSRLLEILDNPKLTLDRPGEDGFDPYNTGAFNRSASWEKISRHKR